MFQKIKDEKVRQQTRVGVTARFQELEHLKSVDEGLYHAQIERIKVEDQIAVLLPRIKAAKTPEKRDELKTELKARVADLVDCQQRFREERRRFIAARLSREIEGFSKRRDQLIVDRTDQLLTHGFNAINMGSGGGMGGGGGFGGGGHRRLFDMTTRPGE